MPVCEKCGKDSAIGTAVCTECGTAFPRRKANLAGTMVGMPSPVGPGGPLGQEPASPPAQPNPAPAARKAQPAAPTAQPSPVAQKKAALSGTMIGMPTPVAPSAAAAPEPAAPKPTPAAAVSPQQDLGLGRTMVGMGAPDALVSKPPPNEPPPGGSRSNQPEAPAQQAEAKKPELKGTLLGIAQPGIAPDQSQAPAPPGASKAQFKGTLLGVAQPGIAPDPNASTAPPPAPQPQSVAPAVPSAADDAPPSSLIGTPAGVPRAKTRISPKQLLFAGGAVLFAGLVGGAIAVMGPRAVTVQVDKFAIDEDGNDKLILSCEECPDGSVLFLDGAEAKVEGSKATLKPREPLNLGRNELEFQLREGEEIRGAHPVILPIAFRVLTNWTGLNASPPHAEVTVAAPDGSTVTVAGIEIPVKNQKAVHRVPFDEETLGESKKMEQVKANLDITVVVDGKPRKTKAELRNGITPLSLTSPPLVHHLGGKEVTIAGTTAPGAAVTVGDEKLEADDKGRFSVAIGSPDPGEVLVTAQSKDLVARRVIVELTKDAPIPEGAVTKFSEIQPGVQVNLLANVIESRTAAGATRALVEVSQGCEAPPCLLRAVYAEPKKLAPNRRVRLIGLVAGGSPLTVRVSRFR